MSAGDLIEKDHQFELRGTLHGTGTTFDNDRGGWTGLGLPAWKTQDVELDGDDGSFLGRDYYASRILTFPVTWHGTQAEVMESLLDLTDAWSRSSSDLELWMRLPGWGLFYVTGRPRGLQEDLSRLASGEGAALLTFVAGDPAITFAPPPGS